MRRIHKLIIQDVIQSHKIYQYEKKKSVGDRLQYLTSKDTIESTIKKEVVFHYADTEIDIHQEIILPSNPKPYGKYTYCKYQLTLTIRTLHSWNSKINTTETFQNEKAFRALQLLLEEVELREIQIMLNTQLRGEK